MNHCLNRWDMVSPAAHRHHILADGNCQFRSLSWAMYGTDERHDAVRRTVCNYIKQNPDKYKDCMECTPREYVDQMQRDGTYGDHITVQAFCDAFHTNVAVIDDRDQVTLLNGHKAEADKYKVLLYEGGIHYNGISPSHAAPTSYMLNKIRPGLNIENTYRFDAE